MKASNSFKNAFLINFVSLLIVIFFVLFILKLYNECKKLMLVVN